MRNSWAGQRNHGRATTGSEVDLTTRDDVVASCRCWLRRQRTSLTGLGSLAAFASVFGRGPSSPSAHLTRCLVPAWRWHTAYGGVYLSLLFIRSSHCPLIEGGHVTWHVRLGAVDPSFTSGWALRSSANNNKRGTEEGTMCKVWCGGCYFYRCSCTCCVHRTLQFRRNTQHISNH